MPNPNPDPYSPFYTVNYNTEADGTIRVSYEIIPTQPPPITSVDMGASETECELENESDSVFEDDGDYETLRESLREQLREREHDYYYTSTSYGGSISSGGSSSPSSSCSSSRSSGGGRSSPKILKLKEKDTKPFGIVAFCNKNYK